MVAWWLAWTFGCATTAEPPVSVATFNVEQFPRSDAQVERALSVIEGLSAPVIALQEIRDPDRLRAEAAERLGPRWRFVTHPDRRGALRVGVLFDGSRLSLDTVVAHESVRVTAGGRPALEVRLLGPARPLRLFVVHLKAGRSSLDVRRKQMAALTSVVRAASGTGDDVVVLGDFNSVLAADRVRLASFAEDTDLPWTSRDIGCTALRQEGDVCRGAALDHVFGTRTVAAAGPCAQRCDWLGGCPRFIDEVSDHCPIVGSVVGRVAPRN